MQMAIDMSMTDDDELQRFARAVSRILGWSYFLAWSISFYPQPLSNWKRQSTKGFAIDFPLANIFGMAAYTISNSAFLFSPLIREQYAQRHHGQEPTIRANDFFYSLHAVVLCLIAYSQFWPSLWGFDVGKDQKCSKAMIGLCLGTVIVALVSIIAEPVTHSNGQDALEGWAWIDVINTFGYIKLFLTIVKYVPQIWLNIHRKSTVGWSIGQILLDLAGSVLSMLQLVIDSMLQSDWSGITGNPAKFGLANITLLVDIIFMFQHYVLYRTAQVSSTEEEQEALIDGANL